MINEGAIAVDQEGNLINQTPMQTPMKQSEMNINEPDSMQMMNAQDGLQ